MFKKLTRKMRNRDSIIVLIMGMSSIYLYSQCCNSSAYEVGLVIVLFSRWKTEVPGGLYKLSKVT